MLNHHRRLFGLVLFVSMVGTNISVRAQGDGPLILDDPQTSYSLGLNLEFLEDPGGALTIDEVTGPEFAGRFTACLQEVPNLGPTESVYWFRFRVRNQTGLEAWRLAFSNARLGLIDLYVPASEDSTWVHLQAGTYIPASQRAYVHPHFVFPLSLASSDETTIYLRMESVTPIRISLSLWQAEAFERYNHTFFLSIGLFYGMVAIMLVYHLLLFFFTRWKSYLYCFFFVLFYALIAAASDGTAQLYIFPNFSFKYGLLGTIFAATVCSVFFIREFLELKLRVPWLNKVLIALTLIQFLAIGLFVISPLFIIVSFFNLLLIPFLSIVGGILVWRQGLVSARAFLLGWGFLLLDGILFNATSLGLLRFYPPFDVSLYIDCLSLVFFLSLALADQVNLLKTKAVQAEIANNASEERFRATFEQAAVGIAHVSLGGRFLRVNQKYCEIVGYTRNELQKLSFQDITHPEDIDTNVENLGRLVAGQQEVYTTEKRYIKKGGQPVWVKLTTSSIQNTGSEPEYFVTVIEDITSRKGIEQALNESERKYRILVEHANAGIVVIQEGKIIFANSFVEGMSGYSTRELLNTSFISHIVEDEHPRIFDLYQRRIAGEYPTETYETAIKHKDGSRLEVEVNAVITALNGKLADLVVIRDVTERKQAVDALQERKERYRLALQSGSIALWQVDLATGRWELDGALEQISGYTAEEMGSYFSLEEIVYSEDRRWTQEFWQKMINGDQEQYSVVHRILHKDGSVRWVNSHGSTVRDEKGQVIRVLGTTRDITETKRAEELVTKSQAVGHVGSWELEPDTKRITLSDEVYRIYGVNPEHVIPTYPEFLIKVHPEDRAMVEAAFWNSIHDGKDTYEMEHRIVQADTGEIVWVLEKYTHLRDESGRVVRSVGMILDITKRKQAEDALYQSREKLAILNRASQAIILAGLNSERVFTAVRAACAWLVPADVVAISLIDHAAGEAEDVFLMDRDSRLHGSRYALEGSCMAEVLEGDATVVVNDFQDRAYWPWSPSGVRSGMTVLLRGSTEIMGMLNVQSYVPNAYSEADCTALESFSAHVSITLENIRRYKQLERSAVIEERQRLASELHDSVTQLLYSIAMMSSGWGLKASQDQLPNPAKHFYQIEELSLQALKDMRVLIHQLRLPVLAKVGLVKALEDRLEKVERRLHIEAQVHVEGVIPKFSEVVEGEIYFIVLEALNNSLRHARATAIQIDIRTQGDHFHISIEDNGRGYDISAPSSGMGTAILNNRAATIGARLKKDSHPGQGTRIELVIGI